MASTLPILVSKKNQVISPKKKRLNTYAKGQRSKYKTKKYLEERGYKCEYSEFFLSRGHIKIKKDLFFSDIIATRKDRVLFVQVKSNKNHVKQAVADYQQLQLPANCYKIVVLWLPRIKKPIITKA
jgi:Holliday junction resolvase-like predicted endonuclease